MERRARAHTVGAEYDICIWEGTALPWVDPPGYKDFKIEFERFVRNAHYVTTHIDNPYWEGAPIAWMAPLAIKPEF